MASQLAKNKEDKRLAEFENEPGMTKIKKPKTADLVQDGVIDLKRVRHRAAVCSCRTHQYGCIYSHPLVAWDCAASAT